MVARRQTRAPRRSRRRRARKASTPKAPRRRRRSTRRSSRRRASKRRTRRRVTRKPRKAKKPMKIGKAWQVWNGTRERTVGGLTKKDLCRSKTGKIVSRKKAQLAKKRMNSKSGIGGWCKAVKQARKELGLVGFVACKKGSPFYKRVNQIYRA